MTGAARCPTCDGPMTHDATVTTDTHRTDYWYCPACDRYHRDNEVTDDPRQGSLFA